MIDGETTLSLRDLEERVNQQIDRLIVKRDQSAGDTRYCYRYVTRKLEQALGAIHKAQDKING